MKQFTVTSILCFFSLCFYGQNNNNRDIATNLLLDNGKFKIGLSGNGSIKSFVSKIEGRCDTVQFRTDEYSGPSFESIILHQMLKGKPVFSALKDSIHYQLEYKLTHDAVIVIASIHNNSKKAFAPESVGLCLGINNYMESYPSWSKILFPTLLRSERTHFWGYFMSPNGKILAIASPNPIPSWTIGYERKEKFPHYVGSHRINTSYLDLLRAKILNVRQPQNRRMLIPGQELVDSIYFTPVKSLSDLNKTVSSKTKAPYISFDRYTLYPEEETTAVIISESPITKAVIKQEDSIKTTLLKVRPLSGNEYQLSWIAPKVESRFIVQVTNAENKTSEAILYVRTNWSSYLSQARKSGLRYLPTTTPNAEAFHPLYSYFLARKYLPDSIDDALAEQVYHSVFPLLFDPETREMREGKYRLQNAATMASILADRFVVTRDTNDLVNAHGLVEFLIRNQRADGSFYNYEWKWDYTAVNYVVKKIMEVLTQEFKLAQHSEIWKQRYNTGMRSIPLALNNLYVRRDNLETEGQMTFDDGPVACCAGQLALGALRTNDTVLRQKYLAVAMEVLEKHNCLAQDIIPDARMNGATLRFWESQFTINLMHNMMDSPCGWSTRKIFANYYLYLLTGKKELLSKVMNALGACMQLINLKNGDLYFAFVPDPYIKDQQFLPADKGSRIPTLQPVVVGEQYLPLISDWHTPPFYAWRPGVFGIDNFVHDVFRCAEEIVIQQSYLIENEDGSFITYNCKLEKKDGLLQVTPYEKFVKSIHVNLKNTHSFHILFDQGPQLFSNVEGMKWLGEIPEEIRTYELMESKL
jgi:hypothetical protein